MLVIIRRTRSCRTVHHKILFTRRFKNFVRRAYFCFFDVRWKIFALKILFKQTNIHSFARGAYFYLFKQNFEQTSRVQ